MQERGVDSFLFAHHISEKGGKKGIQKLTVESLSAQIDS
jgi:hypothetical protein